MSTVEHVRVLDIDSYVDEKTHWHLEPLLLVIVSGEANLPNDAEKVVHFDKNDLPDGAVWGKDSFAKMVTTHIEAIQEILQ